MKIQIVKIATILLALGASMAYSTTASAATPPGTTGPNTPAYWDDTNDNIIGSHFMRMSMQNGQMMMDPNGMLMQHHFGAFGTATLNPAVPAGSGTMPTSGASNMGGIPAQIVIDLPNFLGSFDSTNMRVEVLSFNDGGPGAPTPDLIATVNSVTGTNGGSAVGVSQVGSTTTQLDLVLPNSSVWDYSYSDFVLTGSADAETITIDTNGANVGQIFLWTQQVTAVPVPAAVWLFGTAIIGLFTTSRRRNISTATVA